MLGLKKDNGSTEKKNWYADRYQYVVVQRNVLTVVTLVSLVCALGAAFSISQLAPLKSVEPFVIQVDQKSGITQVVRPQTAQDLTANEAVNDYFMVQYMRARESYGVADAQNYNIVRVMSDPTIFREYATLVSPNNPTSLVNTLGNRAMRRIKVGTISLMDSKTDYDGLEKRRYQIHLLVGDESAGKTTQSYYKLVTMAFKYVELTLSAEDKYLNPLGFRVVEYRIDDDTLNK